MTTPASLPIPDFYDARNAGSWPAPWTPTSPTRPAFRLGTGPGQFMGEAFEAALADRGIDHRRGAVGQHGSIAIIERLWRTAKECLDLKAARPNVPAILRERSRSPVWAAP